MDDTAGAHVWDTTTTEESTAPSGRDSIVTHILETSVQSSRLSRTMEEILGAYPMNDDNFWGGNNLGDVSIDTTNNEKMMARSHTTESHTHTHTHTHKKNQFHLSY